MPRPRNPYQENGFALLGMPTSAPTRELVGRARRLEKRIRAGLDDTDLSLVMEARRRLEDPNQRLAEELFCHGGQGGDESELVTWIDRLAAQPKVSVQAWGEGSDWQRWRSTLHRLPARAEESWSDPEPIRVTVMERGDRYEQVDIPVEAISFDR
jgi:hypothetical protein